MNVLEAFTQGGEKPAVPVSKHFPPVIRDALIAASRVWTDADPLARIKAIDRAADRARALYPELFRY